MILFLKTFILLLPLAWPIMGAPIGNKMFLVWGIFGLIELGRIKGAIWELKRAWPIAGLVMVYVAIRFLTPEVNELQETYDFRLAIYTVVYSIPSGFCLGFWSRNGNAGQRSVFWGYILFCLGLVVAGCFMVNAEGARDVLTWTNEGLSRSNPATGVVYLRFFQLDNVVIGVVPFSIFSLSALPAIITPGQIWPKVTLMAAISGAIYINLMVGTRTAFFGALVAIVCLMLLPLRTERFKKLLRRFMIMGGLILSAGAVGLFLDRDKFYFLVDRFSQTIEDERLYIWRESLALMMYYPMGGGLVHLSEAPWAHNLFLDFALLGGIPAMIVMLALYGFVFVAAWRAIRDAKIFDKPLGVALIGGLVGSFAVNMLMPPVPVFIMFTTLVGSYALASLKTRNTSVVSARGSYTKGNKLLK
jgi:O-antigen ligase